MGTVRNARVNQGGPKCAGIVGLGLIGGSFARGYAQAASACWPGTPMTMS